ncbi:efflux RND transporter periplasmic adaptor subunit [uncultured Microscilla sp.]|uniref:efflux RND transporter periplasmic adaptor subunit n=1 Tax=uncultured Microscilla sp. TaxID=432653 RepID=UPI00263663EC|nr:efflux RND transporter periplasmic adaptor subunit [uncultured Microscilla sp.]
MDKVIQKKQWTPKKVFSFGGAGGLLLLLLIYSFFGNSSSKLNVSQGKITVASVQKANFQEFIVVDGIAQPIKTVFLDIIEGGRVEKIFVEDGYQVKKGDSILKFTNTALQIDFMNRESQLLDMINERQTTQINMRQNELQTLNELADIEYRLKQAKRNHRRDSQLMKGKAIAKQVYFTSKDNYDYQQRKFELAKRSIKQNTMLRTERLNQLDASIQRMQRNIGLSQRTLDNLYVIAPISGQLSTLKAEVGESKSPGENIGQIDDLDGYKINVGIDEHYISKVYTGLKGTFELEGKSYELVVKKVYPEVQSGEFKVDMEFLKTIPAKIRRGQTLQIKLQLSSSHQAVLIPRGGFYQVTGGGWIFVVNPNGDKAVKRNIKLGRQNPHYYEVTQGLKPGEKVVVSSYEGYENIDQLVLQK